MITQEKAPRRFDLRALPIAVKLVLGVLVLLLISGLITDRLIQGIVRGVQTDLSQIELEKNSQAYANQVVLELQEAVETLTRLGRLAAIQGQLKLVAQEVAEMPEAEDTAFLPTSLLDQYVVAFSQAGPGFDAVAVLDTEGRILAIDPPLDESVLQTITPSSVDDWGWFNAAYNRGAGKTYISGPIDDGLTNQTGIHIAVPVYDVRVPDQVIGVIYGVWNIQSIADTGAVAGETFGTMVLEPDGTVLVSSSADLSNLPPRLVILLNQSPSEAFTFTDEAGRDWLYGYTSLSDLGLMDESLMGLRWIVAARQSLAAAQAGSSALLNQLRLTAGLSGLIIGLSLFLLTRGTLRPLRQLTEAANRIEGGDLSAPIPQLPADEVGRLADTLRSLVNQLLYRVRRLQAAVQVSRVATQMQDVDQMLEDIAHALEARFEYPDVRIYLTDSAGKTAWLRAAGGAEGQRLLKQRERLAVVDSTLVGRAILFGEPQIGAGRPALHKAGFTASESELTLPLRAGEETLGALYIMAGRLIAFDPEDINLMRLVADQIGASIQNARLLEQTAASLAEIEMLNRRLTRHGWDEYLDTAGTVRHTPDPAQQWPVSSLAAARGQHDISAEVYTDDDGRSVLAAPLILRGESIGSIGVTRPANYRWTQDEVALVESIAARMAIIAEGIRLVDEAAMAAQREQTINEVSARLLQRAASVDTILQRALGELSGALGSDHVSLRIGAPPVDSERQLTPTTVRSPEAGLPDNGDEADAGDIGEPDRLSGLLEGNGDGG